MLKSLFKIVAGRKSYNFIKKRPKHKRFPVTFLKNTSGGFFWTPHKTDTDKGRSRCKIFLKLTMKDIEKETAKNKSIVKNKDMFKVHQKNT